jgi:hypothetical protein
MSTTVVYDPTPALERSRLTVFFRYFLVLPHFVTLMLYGIGFMFSVIASWFAMVITGKYPAGLYAFNVKVLKYQARLNSYMYLQVDQYPPFGLDEYPDYPTQLHIGPAQESYSRAKAFFRIILGIPVMIIAYVMQIIVSVMDIVVWIMAVITGKTSEGLHGPLNLGLSYYARAASYFSLVTEDWPAVTQDPALTAGSASGSISASAPPPPPPPPAPAAASPFGE